MLDLRITMFLAQMSVTITYQLICPFFRGQFSYFRLCASSVKSTINKNCSFHFSP